jgi:hypothetical protein
MMKGQLVAPLQRRYSRDQPHPCCLQEDGVLGQWEALPLQQELLVWVGNLSLRFLPHLRLRRHQLSQTPKLKPSQKLRRHRHHHHHLRRRHLRLHLRLSLRYSIHLGSETIKLTYYL